MMNVYRWCAVPCCSSTSIKTPNKLFISVPMKPVIRNKWLILARRDPAAISPNSGIYFCEDHFDLPNDMQNYMRYHIMGSEPKVLMKSGCVPTKFECQQGKTKRLSDTAERSSVSKKSKKVLMDEKDIVKQSTTTTQLEFSGSSWHSPVQEQEEVEVKIENTEEYLIEAEENYQFESVQVDERFHDKEVQTKPELVDKLVETWPVQSRSKAVQVNAPPEITVMELVKKETEKMMVRVYKYLCEELEVMKLMSAEEVMIGLEQVSSRAAHATGVSDLTMQRVLEEHQIKTPQQPQNKRKRRKKRNNSHSLVMQRTEEAIASAAVFIPEAVERSDMEVDCAGDRSMDEALVWLKVEVDDSGGDTTDSAPEEELKIIKDEPVSDDLNDPYDPGEELTIHSEDDSQPKHAHTYPKAMSLSSVVQKTQRESLLDT